MLTNKCEFMGTIYEISGISMTQNGKKCCKVTISCRGPKLSDGRALYEYAHCVGYGNTAELLANYFHKGKAISVMTHYHAYQGNDGKYYHDFIIDDLAFVPSDFVEQEAQNQPQAQPQRQQQRQQTEQYAAPPLSVSPDDLPF